MDKNQELKYDQMIALLKELKESPKFSTTVKVITTKSEETLELMPGIELDPDKTYKAALTSFSTFNSLKNVFKDENDKFKYSKDNGKTWKIITLQPGSYEIDALNKEIKRQIGIDKKEDLFQIETAVIRISMTLDEDYQVNFNIDNSLAKLLGFNRKIYTKGYHIGENLPKITDINSIVVHCDLIEGGYLKGRSTNALYSFPSHKVPIGYKIIQEPTVLTYFPVTRSTIHDLRVWFTDENQNPIEFSGEDIMVDILIREF